VQVSNIKKNSLNYYITTHLVKHDTAKIKMEINIKSIKGKTLNKDVSSIIF